jgi:hypothetical protein
MTTSTDKFNISTIFANSSNSAVSVFKAVTHTAQQMQGYHNFHTKIPGFLHGKFIKDNNPGAFCYKSMRAKIEEIPFRTATDYDMAYTQVGVAFYFDENTFLKAIISPVGMSIFNYNCNHQDYNISYNNQAFKVLEKSYNLVEIHNRVYAVNKIDAYEESLRPLVLSSGAIEVINVRANDILKTQALNNEIINLKNNITQCNNDLKIKDNELELYKSFIGNNGHKYIGNNDTNNARTETYNVANDTKKQNCKAELNSLIKDALIPAAIFTASDTAIKAIIFAVLHNTGIKISPITECILRSAPQSAGVIFKALYNYYYDLETSKENIFYNAALPLVAEFTGLLYLPQFNQARASTDPLRAAYNTAFKNRASDDVITKYSIDTIVKGNAVLMQMVGHTVIEWLYPDSKKQTTSIATNVNVDSKKEDKSDVASTKTEDKKAQKSNTAESTKVNEPATCELKHIFTEAGELKYIKGDDLFSQISFKEAMKLAELNELMGVTQSEESHAA